MRRGCPSTSSPSPSPCCSTTSYYLCYLSKVQTRWGIVTHFRQYLPCVAIKNSKREGEESETVGISKERVCEIKPSLKISTAQRGHTESGAHCIHTRFNCVFRLRLMHGDSGGQIAAQIKDKSRSTDIDICKRH